ncbi:MAG: AI-2E family transporter [Hyphomicrobiales bacterium]|nr:AI-2E family transporter [Hyphomicrobiales bacterium]
MSEATPRTSRLPALALQILAAGLVLAVLIVGKSFLIPLAIAVLVWGLLNAIIARIEDIRIGPLALPRWLSTILGIALVALAVLAVVRILASQADAVAEAWPRYAMRLEALFSQTMAWLGPEVARETQEMLAQINIAAQVSGFVGSAGSLLLTTILVIIYVGFLMAERGTIAPKLAALFPGREGITGVRDVVASVSESVRRYMWIKSIMSVLTGATSYAVMKAIGLDFAETWALIILLLNYIPNIGSVLGVVFPALLALVQFDTLAPFLIIAVGLTAVQFAIGNVLEPMFMGSSLNLSAFVIILSLTFWGTIWGLVGMFLSVPIAVMTMVVCAHVPRLRWIAILLSRDGQLETEKA